MISYVFPQSNTAIQLGMYNANVCLVVQTQKDLPTQFLLSSLPLRCTLLLASFGESQAFSNHVFNLAVKPDANVPVPIYEKPLRYGKREEINHIFKADAKSGPVLISVVFVLAILATVPVLLASVRTPLLMFYGMCVNFGLNSGHTSAPTSPTSRKQLPRLQSHTRSSSGRS